jgi:hypothetical protein
MLISASLDDLTTLSDTQRVGLRLTSFVVFLGGFCRVSGRREEISRKFVFKPLLRTFVVFLGGGRKFRGNLFSKKYRENVHDKYQK